MFAITGGKVITGEEILQGKSVIIHEGKIADITSHIPGGIGTIDAEGCFVSPGFMDIHIHGIGGHDTMDGSYETIDSMSKHLASHGVTSFLPTTVTDDIEVTKKAVHSVKESMIKGVSGAKPLGVHLEGPFLSVNAKGAHNEVFLKEPSIDLLSYLCDGDFSTVKRITIAPELNNAEGFIKFIVGQGIIASLGHSDGTYEDTMRAIELGVTHSTHLYNAMKGFNHREPGVVGAIFDSRINTEIIADGIHVHFAAIRTAIAIKGYKSCALITDALRPCCLGDGVFNFGGLEVHVIKDEARLKNGKLAGSTLTLDKAVRNIIHNTNLCIPEAVSMASSVPARICNVDDAKGYIKAGYDADIAIFDKDINVQTTIIGGKIFK